MKENEDTKHLNKTTPTFSLGNKYTQNVFGCDRNKRSRGTGGIWRQDIQKDTTDILKEEVAETRAPICNRPNESAGRANLAHRVENEYLENENVLLDRAGCPWFLKRLLQKEMVELAYFK